MRGVPRNLNLKGFVETFVNVASCYATNKDKGSEDERPVPTTAAEWKQILVEDADLEGDEEELPMEGAEEERLDDEEEEGDADSYEPLAKKAKAA